MNILVVEDNADDRKLFRYMLESRFSTEVVRIQEAHTLEKALDVLCQGGIDCIILDLNLPDSTGKATFTQLHERYYHIPIIVMTHTKDRQLAIEMVQSGASDYIFKQFTDEEELFNRILLTIERHQSQTITTENDFQQALLKRLDAQVLETQALQTQFNQLKQKMSDPPLILEDNPDTISFGQKSAESVAKIVGSWRFIVIQSTVILLWVTLNTLAGFPHWDSYPFILMNLALSLQAAYTAPLIMMAQNRLSQKDRIIAKTDYELSHHDYVVSQEIQSVVQNLQAQMNMQQDKLDTIVTKLTPRVRGEFPSQM
jgi:uncharacterized membrane protein/AmiR/NasT family two-component response regulator